jgi:hypothetical protein
MPGKDDPKNGRPRRQREGGPPWILQTAPKHELRCPTCLMPVDPKAVTTQAYNGGTVRGEMPVTGRLGLAPRPQPVSIDQMLLMGRHTCPRNHTLPRELFTIGVKSIALLGLSQSMKTHYIAALAYELIDQGKLAVLDRQRRLRFVALDECNARLRRDYLALFDPPHKRLLPTEPERDRTREPVRDPIILEAKFVSDQPLVLKREHRTYVSLFDAPGEMFNTARDSMIHAPYLLDPSGILLFVDVGALLPVRAALGEDAPAFKSRMDPHVIDVAAASMKSSRGTTKSLGVPVSVIISRADLLQKSTAFSEYESVLGSEPLLDDGANELARQFVEDYAGGVAMAIADNFKSSKVRYFFASATGSAPDAAENFPSVKPWGCLGPLLWLLTADGFIRG